MSANSLLFDTLQREFCPPLDSSLLAALLAELESDAAGNVLVPTPVQIESLRTILQELSSQADETQLSEFSDLQLTPQTDDTSSTPEFYHGNTATGSSLTSDSSDSSQHSFSTPIGFLQAALPHISTQTLNSALESAGSEDMDMWEIIAGILTAESIREMEERGLSGLEDEDLGLVLGNDEADWETVDYKKKPPPNVKANKRRNARGKTYTLVDVRQQQNAPPSLKRSNTDASCSAIGLDTWTQLASLSSLLTTLLPAQPQSLFQSYFHSPNYPTPYLALHACLRSICSSPPELSDNYMASLGGLLEVLLPQYDDDDLDSEQRDRLISDVEVSLQVTSGQPDLALDLAKLLRELDSDSTGKLEMGVYHQAPSNLKTESRHQRSLPTGPPPVQPPPQVRPKPKPPPVSPTEPNLFQWKTVPLHRNSNSGPHPLAAYIPAYADRKAKGVGNTLSNGGKGDVDELSAHQRSMRKRNELLKQATKMWQRGNTRTRGGEIAFYFAERAREFQELARVEALNAARTMVESKRLRSNDPYTADLHGTTAFEAVTIVKEILQYQPTSFANPLKIITGRGSHSVNQVSVLKPAIKKALVDDGWNVGSWNGGLIVRGKT